VKRVQNSPERGQRFVSDPIQASPNDNPFRTEFLRRVSKLRLSTRGPASAPRSPLRSPEAPPLPSRLHPREQNHERPVTPTLPHSFRQTDMGRFSEMTDSGRTTFSVLIGNDDTPHALFSRPPVEPRAL